VTAAHLLALSRAQQLQRRPSFVGVPNGSNGSNGSNGGSYTAEHLTVLTFGGSNCVAGGQEGHPLVPLLRSTVTAIVYKHDIVPRTLGPCAKEWIFEFLPEQIRGGGAGSFTARMMMSGANILAQSFLGIDAIKVWCTHMRTHIHTRLHTSTLKSPCSVSSPSPCSISPPSPCSISYRFALTGPGRHGWYEEDARAGGILLRVQPNRHSGLNVGRLQWRWR
jgi:hypothetical protein